ncbi:SGNH/GDSL hydrolase family protein [Streptomyces sp. NPDC000994]
MTITLKSGSTVVFIGDSITDSGRDREDPDSLGSGFAALAAARFTAADARTPVRFVNRGISGNRAVDLRERWHQDCLTLEPDVVSFMIGINEVWRRFDSNNPTPDAVFEGHCRHILEQTADHGAQLIMMEPFLLPVSAEQRQWRDELEGKLAVVRGLAKEFSATLIPTDALMTEAAIAAGGPDALAHDGVHPTPKGHSVLAQAWLAAAGSPAGADDGTAGTREEHR